jgi:hypothetical protein
VELLRALLARGGDATLRDADGDTPLHACESVECAALLLGAGADLTAQNDEGQPPLVTAAEDGRREMVAWLLSQYAARGMPLPEVELAGGDEDGDGEREGDEEDDEEDGDENGLGRGVQATGGQPGRGAASPALPD